MSLVVRQNALVILTSETVVASNSCYVAGNTSGWTENDCYGL